MKKYRVTGYIKITAEVLAEHHDDVVATLVPDIGRLIDNFVNNLTYTHEEEIHVEESEEIKE